MSWVLAFLLAVLAYLSFGHPSRQVAGLRQMWLILVGVLGLQALGEALQASDSDLRVPLSLIDAASWALMAWVVFMLANTLAADSGGRPASPQPPPPAQAPPAGAQLPPPSAQLPPPGVQTPPPGTQPPPPSSF